MTHQGRHWRRGKDGGVTVCEHCTPEQRKAYVEALLNNPNSTDPQVRQIRSLLDARPLPIHRTEAGYPHCSTCDGGGCLDCTDPA